MLFTNVKMNDLKIIKIIDEYFGERISENWHLIGLKVMKNCIWEVKILCVAGTSCSCSCVAT